MRIYSVNMHTHSHTTLTHIHSSHTHTLMQSRKTLTLRLTVVAGRHRVSRGGEAATTKLRYQQLHNNHFKFSANCKKKVFIVIMKTTTKTTKRTTTAVSKNRSWSRSWSWSWRCGCGISSDFTCFSVCGLYKTKWPHILLPALILAPRRRRQRRRRRRQHSHNYAKLLSLSPGIVLFSFWFCFVCAYDFACRSPPATPPPNCPSSSGLCWHGGNWQDLLLAAVATVRQLRSVLWLPFATCNSFLAALCGRGGK